MPDVDRRIKHYRINHETGERTVNTDFNAFIVLNAVFYVFFLILIFTVGAFGSVSSTTQVLAYRYQSALTPDAAFFKTVWALVIPWHGFWAVWPIARPEDRNCPGVVRASYWYPFLTLLYAGYTISCRYDAIIAGTVFCCGMCATLIGLVMSLQRFRSKRLPGYLIWQGPMSLLAAWMMVETMLMINGCFVVLAEEWIIKIVIGGISLLALFVTAIAWLSSYPVDLIVPSVLAFAFGGIYLELRDYSHIGNLYLQGYGDRWQEGARYTVLAVFLLVLASILLKIFVVLVFQRPKDLEEQQRRKNSSRDRVNLSITINTGDGKNNKNNKNGSKNIDGTSRTNRSRSRSSDKNRRNYRKNRDTDYYDDDDNNNIYGDVGYDYDEERPRRQRSGSSSRRQQQQQQQRSSSSRRGSGTNGSQRSRRSEGRPSSSTRSNKSKNNRSTSRSSSGRKRPHHHQNETSSETDDEN